MTGQHLLRLVLPIARHSVVISKSRTKEDACSVEAPSWLLELRCRTGAIDAGPSRALEPNYPDFNGRWVRVGSPNWVQPAGTGAFNETYDPRMYVPPPPAC